MFKTTKVRVFLAFVKAGLWGSSNENTNLNTKVNWGKVYQLAQEQSVQGLVLQGVEELRTKNSELRVPQGLLLQWISEVKMIEQRNKAMNVFVADLIEKLRKHDIYALLVKGQGIAQCYEKPLWRVCGDVDLFLSKDNYDKAKQYLVPLANHIGQENVGKKHLGLIIESWTVELHGSLRGSLSRRMNNVLDEIKNETFYGGSVSSWKNGETDVFLLSTDNNILYVFTHILNHFYKGGIGLRQICDWCRLVWTYRDSLNHELLESKIRKAGLMSEWKAFGAFAVEYLGMPIEAMPLYSPDMKWKRKADRICSFIMEVGNMGHNRDNSYYNKPFIVRKAISFSRRCSDLIRHARIFPLDSLRFFPYLLYNGLKAAAEGES